MSHTPAPWHVVQYYRNRRARIMDLLICTESETPIALLRNANDRAQPQIDAALIAAAPDLLRGCEAALRQQGDATEIIRAAVIKAKAEYWRAGSGWPRWSKRVYKKTHKE